MSWWQEARWPFQSLEKWKNTNSLILPLAFQVTTHLEIVLFALFPSPPHSSPLCRPSHPGPSPWVLKPRAWAPLSTNRPSGSPFPVCRPYLCRGWDMVQGFLLSRAHGGHVGQEVSATDPGQIAGPWVSASSLSLGFLCYKMESGTSPGPA